MLTLIMFIAGYIDLRYRKIPWFIILLLFIYVVLFRETEASEMMLIFLFIVLPIFILACMNTNMLKGGDMKYIAMLTMVMNISSFIALLVFTTVYSAIFSLVTKQKSIPLAAFVFIAWITMRIIYI